MRKLIILVARIIVSTYKADDDQIKRADAFGRLSVYTVLYIFIYDTSVLRTKLMHCKQII